MGTITAANASLVLTVPGVFVTPQILKGWSTDDAFSQTPVAIGMSRIGVDGFKSSAFIPNIRELTITFQADSPSIIAFDNWVQACKAAKELFPGSLLATLPSIGKAFVMTEATLRDVLELPPVKRALEPMAYILDLEDISPIPA